VFGLWRACAVFSVRMRHRARPVGCFKRQTLENLQPRNRQPALLPSGQQMAAQSGTPRREASGGCVQGYVDCVNRQPTVLMKMLQGWRTGIVL